MDQEQLATIIAGVSAFSGLDENQLELVTSLFTERHVSAGEVLMNEGERGRKFHVVVDGRIRVFLPRGGSKNRAEELDLAVFQAGDVFGEYSFIDLRPASASVQAQEASVLLEVDQQRLHVVLDEHCQIARQVYYNLLLLLIDRLRSDDNELDALTNSWT